MHFLGNRDININRLSCRRQLRSEFYRHKNLQKKNPKIVFLDYIKSVFLYLNCMQDKKKQGVGSMLFTCFSSFGHILFLRFDGFL